MTAPINIPLTLIAHDPDGATVFELDTELVLHVDLRPATNAPNGPLQRVVESFAVNLPAEFLVARLRQWESENEDLQDLNRDILRRFGVRVESLV